MVPQFADAQNIKHPIAISDCGFRISEWIDYQCILKLKIAIYFLQSDFGLGISDFGMY
jgi:hypothetical protein